VHQSARGFGNLNEVYCRVIRGAFPASFLFISVSMLERE
jgi:hypothetical protein